MNARPCLFLGALGVGWLSPDVVRVAFRAAELSAGSTGSPLTSRTQGEALEPLARWILPGNGRGLRAALTADGRLLRTATRMDAYT
jgi:hypothetical protein